MKCVGVLWARTRCYRSCHGAVAVRTLWRKRAEWRSPTSSGSGAWLAHSSDDASYSVCLDPSEAAETVVFPSASYRSHKKTESKSAFSSACSCSTIPATFLRGMPSVVARIPAGPSRTVRPFTFDSQMNAHFVTSNRNVPERVLRVECLECRFSIDDIETFIGSIQKVSACELYLLIFPFSRL